MQATPATPGGGRPARGAAWLPRIAAVLALLAPAAMAVVAAVALAGDVAIAVLAVGWWWWRARAIWFALTARGARRSCSAQRSRRSRQRA